jgi:transcriptional regulator with XRE-family HTH domain
MSSKELSPGEARREYERGMLRAAFGSLFWSALVQKKRENSGFNQSQLASELGVDRSVISKWFNGEPNWQIDTIADLALAFDLELVIRARNRKTGRIHTAFGSQPMATATQYNDDGVESRGARNDSDVKAVEAEFA